MEILLDIFLDALLDTLVVFPFLLLVHILIAVYESSAGSKLKVNKLLNGKTAPLLGASVGLIPQCGFSVVSTKLYSSKNIKLGTLVAVYIATSDEAIPILLASPANAFKLVPLLIIKFAMALIAGYGVNLFLKKKETVPCEHDLTAETGCHGHEIGHKEHIEKKFDWEKFVFHPIMHSMVILLYIFIVNLALGALFEFVGEENITAFLEKSSYLQVPLAALIGLIPNCASSVLITQLYAVGQLSLGACVAGLSVNAGIAFAVLFKENKNLKENILILLGLYAFSVACGILIVFVNSFF